MSGVVTARADSALVRQRREAAEIVRTSRDSCDATHDQVAAGICASRARLSQYADSESDTTMDIARASMSPQPMRAAIAAFVAGPAFVVRLAETHEHRALTDVVRELSEVMTAAAMAEADGHITPDEAQRELDEWADVERVMQARRTMLKRAIAQRGMRIAR